jgi:hypothetical protein
MGGDFNFIFNPEFDRKGGAPIAVGNSRRNILKTMEDITDYLQLKDIWRVRNPQSKRFTWRRRNPDIIKSRLDLWFVSENLEDYIVKSDIVPFINTDHSAIVLELKSFTGKSKGPGIWRLNNSFLNDDVYVRQVVENKAKWLEDYRDIEDARVKWELIKYKIRQISTQYGKTKSRNMKKTETELEEKLRLLEKEQDNIEGPRESILEREIVELKAKLSEIAEYKTKGLILRSQARWYEKGEKSTKYFLQLEKRNLIKKEIKKLQRNDGSFTTDDKEILHMQSKFYEELYSEHETKTREEIENYVDRWSTPKLLPEEQNECEGLLTVDECKVVLKTFKNDKSPGNDGITAEFNKKFWPLF